jgi:hypothetical protein
MTMGDWIGLSIVIWICGAILSGLFSTYPNFNLSIGECFAVGVFWPFVLIAVIIWYGKVVFRICGQLIGFNKERR